MTVLTNFNNYEIGQCGFQGSVYSEMTDLSGVASTDYNITHSGIIIFESDSPADTPNPTLTTGQYRFKIAQSNTDIVDDETSVMHSITVENTGDTDLTFNRIGLILAESATTAIGSCFLVLCDEIEEVVVEPGMTVDFEYTIDLINFLNLYDPQIYIDIETPPTPIAVYDFSNFTKVGNPITDSSTGKVSKTNYYNYLTYNFPKAVDTINSFTIELEFTTTDFDGTLADIRDSFLYPTQNVTGEGNIRVEMSGSNGLALTVNKSSNITCSVLSMSEIQPNTTYRVAWTFDGTNIQSYKFTEEGTAEIVNTINASGVPTIHDTAYMIFSTAGINRSSIVDNWNMALCKVTINDEVLLELPLLNQS